MAGRGQDLDNVETILIRCQRRRRRRAKHAAKATKSPPVTDILIHYNFNIHALEGKGGVWRGEGQVRGGGFDLSNTEQDLWRADMGDFWEGK